MTLTQAQNLKTGQMIYHTHKQNANKTAMRAKVTSIKTWKRSPEKVEVKVKHGIYDYATFTESDLNQISIVEPIYSEVRK